MTRLVYFLAVTFIFISAQAQTLSSRNYNTQDGLLHANVYRIYQDSKGFLWFCTDRGICSFDGSTFRKIDDPLLRTSILGIFENENGDKVITAVNRGMILVNNDRVEKIAFKHQNIPSPLFVDQKFNLYWIVNANNKSEITVCDSLQQKTFSLGTYEQHHSVISVCSTKDELIYCTTNGLYKATQNREIVPMLPDIISGQINAVCIDKEGAYWIARTSSIVKVKDSKIVYRYNIGNDDVISTLFCDSANNIWAAIYGSDLIRIRNCQIEHMSTELKLSSYFINSMAEDSEGNIWLATYNRGAFMIPRKKALIFSLTEFGLNMNCSAICETKNGGLFIGSIGQVALLQGKKIQPISFTSLKKDIHVNFIACVSGNILLGTPFGLFSKNIASCNEKKISTGIKGAISYYKDTRERIWVGDYVGLYYIDSNSQEHEVENDLISGKRVSAIANGDSGLLWIGTSNGLYRYDPTNNLATLCDWGGQSSYNVVNDICFEKPGSTWVATDGGLVHILNDRYIFITSTSGLSDRQCGRILLDGQKRLWIGTSNGLNCLQTDSYEVVQVNDLVNNEEVLSLSMLGQNKLYIGTQNYITAIDTKDPFGSITPPKTYFISANSGDIAYDMPEKLELPANSLGVRVSFIGLNFANAKTVNYRYRIAGFSDYWQYTRNNSIELTALPSGNYSLILNSRVGNGPWSADVVLPIKKMLPIWKQPWFISFVIVTSSLTLFFGAYFISGILARKKRRRLIIQNRIVVLRQQALMAQINPHFIFNCMNSIQHYLNANDRDAATAYLADFAHLIRITLENAEEAFISLASEIERLEMYLRLEKLRVGDRFEFTIIKDDRLQNIDPLIPNMIVQPFVENAVWHGIMPQKDRVGKIEIRFASYENQLTISIKDNGTGSKKANVRQNGTNRKSYGIQLAKDRLRLLKKQFSGEFSVNITSLDDPSSKQTGTEVIVIVPLDSRKEV